MDHHEEFDFSWQSEEHEVAAEALALFVKAMRKRDISEDVLMEVLLSPRLHITCTLLIVAPFAGWLMTACLQWWILIHQQRKGYVIK